jgi:hypothetical protein
MVWLLLDMHAVFFPSKIQGMMGGGGAWYGWSLQPQQSFWVIPIPHIKEIFFTEDLLGRHALGVLGRGLYIHMTV